MRQLFAKFQAGDPGDGYGSKRDYNIDLIPKFVMAKGLLVKILLHTKTTHYLDFAKIDGSFVMAKARVSKVPATAAEALSSNLMVRATACAQVPSSHRLHSTGAGHVR